MLNSIIWSKKKCSFASPTCCKSNSDEDGLRILISCSSFNPSSKIIKPTFSLNQIIHSISLSSSNTSHYDNNCFLKSCHLCHKPLPLDKEVYMYRGELGFCSVACRERQMYVDEMEEIEISTKKILASLERRRLNGGRCETGKLVKESGNKFSTQNNRVVFSHGIV